MKQKTSFKNLGNIAIGIGL